MGVASDEIRGGSPPDVELNAAGDIDQTDPAQWARDASVRIAAPGVSCSGTLVSPRVVLTAGHCVWGVGAIDAVFSPLDPDGSVGPALDGPALVAARASACRIHPEGEGTCGDGLDHGEMGREYDLAILVLEERFDTSRYSRYLVTPARVVELDPPGPFGRDALEWLGTPVRFVGYGRIGLTDERLSRVRLAAESRVSAVYPRSFWAHDFGAVGEPGSVAFAGDSGGGVFVIDPGADPAWADDGRPLEIVGVNYAGDGTSNYAVRLTSSGTRAFLADFLGDVRDHYAGAMVAAGGGEVWTGAPDLPRRGEDGRGEWRDPVTGDTADAVDPDGDGLRGRHDNCWGRFNPRQHVDDVDFRATCVSPTTGATITYGCAPRPAVFDGLGVEITIDVDGDRVPDACDNCPSVPNGSQANCDGDELGDACEANSDPDPVPDDCDNCPGIPNDQRNCNADAEEVLGFDAAGDACDPIPCAGGSIVNRPAGGGYGTPWFEVEPTWTSSGTFPTGFRFCPCDIATPDPSSRRACEREAPDASRGCLLASPALYPSTIATERREWRIPTIFGPTEPDPIVGTEVSLTYDPPVVTAFEGAWDVSASDRPRWAAHPILGGLYPAAVDPLSPIRGVGWFHTVGTAPVSPLLSNHYTSGAIAARSPTGGDVPLPAMEEPMVPVLPLPWDDDYCPYCFERLPVPWLVLPCLDADCVDVDAVGANVALDGRLVLDDHPSFAPPGFEALMTGTDLAGARWAAAPEPASLVGDAALRLGAFDGATGAPLRLLTAAGGAIGEFGKQGSAGGLVPALASELRPAPRSGFLVTVSGSEASAWIAGGVGPSGEAFRDVWRLSAASREWEPLDLTGVPVGRLVAFAYGPLDGRLYILDEVRERHRARMRLLSVPAGGGAVVLEGAWLRTAPGEPSALLAVDSDGQVWLAGTLGRSGAHAVARLRRGRRGRLVPAGFRVGRGELTAGGAFATPRGLSLAVQRRDGLRIVGYGGSDLVPRGGPEGCF